MFQNMLYEFSNPSDPIVFVQIATLSLVSARYSLVKEKPFSNGKTA